MKILIACEMSGVIREAFRERGHDAKIINVINKLKDQISDYEREMRTFEE